MKLSEHFLSGKYVKICLLALALLFGTVGYKVHNQASVDGAGVVRWWGWGGPEPAATCGCKSQQKETMS